MAKNKKIIIIGCVLIAVIALGIFLWPRLNSQPSNVSTATDTPNPGSPPPPAAPSGNTITIGTPNGTVTVKNIYKSFVGWEEEYFTFSQSAGYKFLYNPNNGSFAISINAGPILQTIPQAEAAFLTALGVSKADACKLSVTVGVASVASSDLAGKALGLSFCSVIQ
jgi:hypothetical protein